VKKQRKTDAAFAATLQAIAAGCPPRALKWAYGLTLLQISARTGERLGEIPVSEGGLEIEYVGRHRYITHASILNHQQMRASGKLKGKPVRKRTAVEIERQRVRS
jgi:hypothetical protein